MNWEQNLKQILSQTGLSIFTQESYIKAFRKWMRYFKLEKIECPTEALYKEFATYLHKEKNYTYLNFQQILFSIVGVFKHYGQYIGDNNYRIYRISYLIEILSEGYKLSDKVDGNNITPHAAKIIEDKNVERIFLYLQEQIEIKNNTKDKRINNIREMKMYIALFIAKITGLRRSDIFNIKYENICVIDKKIHLSLIIQKTKREYDIIINNLELLNIFNLYTKRINFKEGNYLFGYIHNGVIDYNRGWTRTSFYRHFYIILSSLNIPKAHCTLVSFRKSLAQTLYEDDCKIEKVMNTFKWTSASCASYIKHNY